MRGRVWAAGQDKAQARAWAEAEEKAWAAGAAADAAEGDAGGDAAQPDRPGRSTMIQVSREHCTGCGACVAACPKGALFVAGSCADVDESLCDSCGLCISMCPEGALFLAAVATEREVQVTITKPPSEPARPESSAIAPVWSRKIVPALGAAIAFAGREILPRIADGVISKRSAGGSPVGDGGANEGRRLRRRRRGA